MLMINFLILWAKLGFNGNFLASCDAELEQSLMNRLVSNRLNLQRGSFVLRIRKNFLAPSGMRYQSGIDCSASCTAKQATLCCVFVITG